MSNLAKLAVAVSFGCAALGISSSAALARIICNEEGDCWHTAPEVVYPPAAGVIVHPDDWKWKEGERFAWREHEGRGYWRRGAWVGF